MESTGVFWIPVYEVLEQRGLEVVLVNARDAKDVPGRKTDVSDAEWLQRLHECGLLRASFRPKGEIATLREYLRQRERLLDYAAAHIQHMQKALSQMNLQLHHVVSDVTGATGMRIIRAVVAGERDPDVLAAMRDKRCQASVEVVRQALLGNTREEHVFALAQALELYDLYQAKVVDCDGRIEAVLNRLRASAPPPAAPLPPPRHRTQQPNAPAFPAREALHAVLGVDLTQIHGLGPYMALKLAGECGTDLSAWPTAKHFTSWLCLAPSNKISGGKLLSAGTRCSASRAAALLRLAAVTVGRTETALGAFYRRLSGRVGKAKAVTATAHKIAALFYNTLRHGMGYVDPGVSYYEERYRRRVLTNLQRRAKALGYLLQEAPAPG
jgi:transposase